MSLVVIIITIILSRLTNASSYIQKTFNLQILTWLRAAAEAKGTTTTTTYVVIRITILILTLI